MRDISLYLSTIPDYNQMLAGKNVLITTAARGIGKSIALLFARQGADVYFGGRNEEYVRTTEKELQSIRPGCRGYVVDLAKADQTEAFVDAAVKDSGGFDILVSTVGVNCHCPAAEYKDEDMFRLLETNYLSGVRCARKVIPTMQARGGGSIINISSIKALGAKYPKKAPPQVGLAVHRHFGPVSVGSHSAVNQPPQGAVASSFISAQCRVLGGFGSHFHLLFQCRYLTVTAGAPDGRAAPRGM